MHRLRRLLVRRDLLRELRQRPIGNLRSTVVVDGRVPQRAVEPRDHRLAVAQRLELVEASREGILEDVLSDVTPPHAPLEEAQELAMVVDEHPRDIGIERSGGLGDIQLVGHAAHFTASETETQAPPPAAIGRSARRPLLGPRSSALELDRRRRRAAGFGLRALRAPTRGRRSRTG